jgi:hypothetical protein
LRLEYPATLVVVRGTLSLFESGSRSVDLSAAASTFTSAWGRFRGEFTGSGGSTIYNSIVTSHVSAGSRLHLLGRSSGAWLSGGAGYLDDGILGGAVTRAGIGLWSRVGAFTLSAATSHVDASPFWATDLEVGSRIVMGAVNFSANFGSRLAAHRMQGARAWGELSGVFWVSRNLALVSAHGRYPSEPGRGTPGGRYTSLSLRVASRPPVSELNIIRELRLDVPTVVRPVVATFQARRINDSTANVVVRAPGARRVEIAGDFTDWQPAERTQRGTSDSFSIEIRATPGSHKFTMRVDAGEWGIPPGVPLVRDELAGHVALLIIPPNSR